MFSKRWEKSYKGKKQISVCPSTGPIGIRCANVLRRCLRVRDRACPHIGLARRKPAHGIGMRGQRRRRQRGMAQVKHHVMTGIQRLCFGKPRREPVIVMRIEDVERIDPPRRNARRQARQPGAVGALHPGGKAVQVGGLDRQDGRRLHALARVRTGSRR